MNNELFFVHGIFNFFKNCFKEFCASVVIVILWFCASCAWADGVGKFKKYTDSPNVCHSLHQYQCKLINTPTYGGLNISLVSN